MSDTAMPPVAVPPTRRRIWLLRVLVLLVVVLAAGGGALYYYADTLIEKHLRPAMIALLEDRFESAVELSSLEVSMVPTLSVRGEGLTLLEHAPGVSVDDIKAATGCAFAVSPGLKQIG